MHLHVDIETYSPIDVKTAGVYRYAEHAEIMLCSYALDDGPITLWDCANAPLPPAELLRMLEDPAIIKWAHNAQFERTLFNKVWRLDTDPRMWRCTMAWGRSLGLPPALGDMAEQLKLPQKKNAAGYALIRKFCVPQKKGPRVYPSADPDDWARFGWYCVDDTAAERAVHAKLTRLGLELPASEWALWEADQRINDRGVRVDTDLAGAAVVKSKERNDALLREAIELTGVNNPRSVKQLKDWLADVELLEIESLNKKVVFSLLPQVDEKARRVLEIRQEVGKSSVTKFAAIERSVCEDGRVHGAFEFYGAQRTGRWAGRLVQLHNLPSNKLELEALEEARLAVRTEPVDELRLWYPNLANVLSELVRCAFLPSGQVLYVVDFSAIEARVLAWGANEEWRLNVFRTHGKIYEASASMMFGVPLETIVKGHANYPLRQKGKVSELALGFAGGVGALKTMGALEMGLVEDELQPIVDAWRKASPRIVSMWYDMERAARKAIAERGNLVKGDKYAFIHEKGALWMVLPSGRRLAYLHARINSDNEIEFDGLDPDTKRWGVLRTYSGKLVENWTQAVARDCLAAKMLAIDNDTAISTPIVMHVHDELVLDGDADQKRVMQHMVEPIPWAKGLPLNAAGFTTPFYRKDA
jgi:DNA polymerase